MADNKKRKRAVAILTRIRTVLYDHWDPIQIKGLGPRDEYDAAIGRYYRLRSRKPTEDEVLDHLIASEPKDRGASLRRRTQLRAVAKKLLAIDLTLA